MLICKDQAIVTVHAIALLFPNKNVVDKQPTVLLMALNEKCTLSKTETTHEPRTAELDLFGGRNST